ncbi:MAG: AAA family ATPase [Bacteroidales bacterium]|nr:AAA family ATPase [Bacteroidales bacterium]
MQRLKRISDIRIKRTGLSFKRYLHNDIHWTDRLIGISGARGTGKTTMLLQQLKQKGFSPDEAMFISLDDIYFANNHLVYFAEDFVSRGGKYLFIDEIHKYPNWSQELKNIYDNLPELHVVFTSSSALDIYRGKYDLSRRALVYTLKGLSFREYIEFSHKIITKSLSLNEILSSPFDYIYEISKIEKPLRLFSEYLQHGYYPFFKESGLSYPIRVIETINTVLESDLPNIFNIERSSVIKLKKFVYLLSSMVPFKPNILKLAEKMEVTRQTLLHFLELLNRANIICLLTADTFGINYLVKPEKIFLENTNLMYALEPDMTNVGTMRETFFLNQLNVKHKVSYPKQGDFLIDNKYIFEIGGKNKTQKQIAGIENAYIAADDIEYGYKNKIPLWLFGFLY